MNDLSISNLKFSKESIGNLIKDSKKYYSWEFILEGSPRKIELMHSRITGKRRIFFDGKEILQVKK